MADVPVQSINHFTIARFRPSFWELPPEKREEARRDLSASLRAASTVCHVYQTFPMAPDADLIVWTAQAVEDPVQPARFFEGMAQAWTGHRALVDTVDVLWGITRPSPYSKGRSARTIDPFAKTRHRYLVAYPFTKTPEWYLLPPEERQQLMSEHIRVGRSHAGIDQLLLYSVGLQDHEFVVVYEMDDLERFLALVAALRETAARAYTAKDTPVRVGVHQES